MRTIKLVTVSIVLSTSFFSTALAAPPVISDVSYDVVAYVQISLKSYPRTEVVRVIGNLDGKNNNITDIDGDGKLDIETEIVRLNLVGTHPVLGEVTVKKNNLQDKKNYRQAEQVTQCRVPTGIRVSACPSNSFFDIFVELNVATFPDPLGTTQTSSFFDVFVTDEPVRLVGRSLSLENASGLYSSRKATKLRNVGTETVASSVGATLPDGTIKILQLQLKPHSPAGN